MSYSFQQVARDLLYVQCTDTSGHTKAFDYPVMGHWRESQDGQVSSARLTHANENFSESLICR